MDNVAHNTHMVFDFPEAEYLLSRCRDHDGVEDAIIAGGCVRDYVFGRPIKDIDIFCSRKYSEAVTKITGITKDLVCAYQDIPDVDTVWNLLPSKPDSTPVQIIAMEGDMTPIERIGTFDWGICQVWYDGEIKYTEHFLNDFLNKTMTLVYCENQHEWDRSMARITRIQQKYPEFTVVAQPRETYPALIKESPIVGGYSICPATNNYH